MSADAGRLVLIVEDDESISSVVADVMEDRGFLVLRAANGKEALRHLDNVRPDVMILDLLMPVMHGWDFMEQYSETTGGESIPIVVLSVNPALPRSFSRFGVRSILAKPFDIEALVQAVDDAVHEPPAERQSPDSVPAPA